MLGRGDAKRNHAWILLSMLSVNLGSSRRSYVIFALHFGYLMDVSYFNYLTITLLKAKSYFYTLNNIYHQQSFAPVRHRNDFITQIMKDKINLSGDWIVFLCVIISRLWFKKKKKKLPQIWLYTKCNIRQCPPLPVKPGLGPLLWCT